MSNIRFLTITTKVKVKWGGEVLLQVTIQCYIRADKKNNATLWKFPGLFQNFKQFPWSSIFLFALEYCQFRTFHAFAGFLEPPEPCVHQVISLPDKDAGSFVVWTDESMKTLQIIFKKKRSKIFSNNLDILAICFIMTNTYQFLCKDKKKHQL